MCDHDEDLCDLGRVRLEFLYLVCLMRSPYVEVMLCRYCVDSVLLPSGANICCYVIVAYLKKKYGHMVPVL